VVGYTEVILQPRSRRYWKRTVAALDFITMSAPPARVKNPECERVYHFSPPYKLPPGFLDPARKGRLHL